MISQVNTSKLNYLLKEINNYSNEKVVIKYSQEYKVNFDEAKMHFEELKRFLALCASSECVLNPSKNLDNIWHIFILFTKDYQEFCKDTLGQFIHHVPEVSIDEIYKFNSEEKYLSTRNIYIETVGIVSMKMWPEPKMNKMENSEVAAICDNGGDCGGSGCGANCNQD